MAQLAIGVDVGSTTAKVVVASECGAALWSDYRRHHGRQAGIALQMLEEAYDRVAESGAGCPVVVTGSGAGPLAPLLGAHYLQEVNAITRAVEALHPDASSVIELGGQDAKIVRYALDRRSGERRALASMNDKCASGTGATLDRCFARIGLGTDALAQLRFSSERLHRVSAKCGVFAETDIVNLQKAGVPAAEIACSLVDAIVLQNLTVLARGATLLPKVLLLGGPNRFLPVLQACWRWRLEQSWRERGHDTAQLSPEQRVVVPPDATLFAARGAALFGLAEPSAAGICRSLEPLRCFVGRAGRPVPGPASAPPLARDTAEIAAFRQRYALPPFVPRPLVAGSTVAGFLGIDGGSTSSKYVLLDKTGELLRKGYRLSAGNPLADVQALLGELHTSVAAAGATLRIDGLGVTGYAADMLDSALNADANVVETVAHLRGATRYCVDADVICDIGGQDIKVLMLRNGALRDFRLSAQCSAGNGTLLQAMAEQCGVPLADYADHALRATRAARFGTGCAVFLDADRVNLQRDGYSREELMAGLARALPPNIWQHAARVARLADLGRRFVLQGGTQHNLAALKAQVDYILERVPDADIHVHPHPGEAGAIGAALEAQGAVQRAGRSAFIGLGAAIALSHAVRCDATTRCTLCDRACTRSFIETQTATGGPTRFIAGAGCEKGEVENAAAWRATLRARRRGAAYPANLAAYEARRCFARGPAPLPAARGRGLRIGMPRALHFWTLAPFFRAYFERLGISPGDLVFSDDTSEELFAAGAKFGAIDPCFPAKLALGHVHNLLGRGRDGRDGVDVIYFPTVTHLPTFVDPVMDSASCPVVAGTPNVVRAALTRDEDRFAATGVAYVDDALVMNEPNLMRQQLFATWGERLGISAAESDIAVVQAWQALAAFEADLEAQGDALIERLEREGRMGVLLLGRPYHLDPGINHAVTEELQALGYPVMSQRAIPKNPGWLARHFGADVTAGSIAGPFDVRDVWPENYSANSAQKVWAAKVAARHPNLAVLDLSSFKCGNDATLYGLVDEILAASRTSLATLHDIDATRPATSIRLRLRTFAHALRQREDELRRSPGVRPAPTHYRERVERRFAAAERRTTTLLMAGLTLAQDQLFTAALRGLGYRAVTLDTPDNAAMRLGKEFGNRGQCNPTYYMVGNLLKYLRRLRDEEGMSPAEIVARYAFITAGACGPCRFGSYLAEYRKALRDAGFGGFRVLTLSQTEGVAQRVGEGDGFRMTLMAFLRIFEAFLVGDLLNIAACRIRPYEIESGATDAALAACRAHLATAFERNGSRARALRRCHSLLGEVAVDRSRIKPRVAVIGEFWAMTTEGDGNYRLQRYLESEGAEVEIQTFTSWMLYVIWQGRFDTALRRSLPAADSGRRGLRGVNVLARRARLALAEAMLRGTFGAYARLLGLRDCPLPDMDELARLAQPHFDNQVRGGEGHMEVGKLLDHLRHDQVAMTLSVKPFGCMPSSGVSDGVQSLIVERNPQVLFLAVETTGDGAVGVYSRIQMQLDKAKQRVRRELEEVLHAAGLSEADYAARLAAADEPRDPLHRSPRRSACAAVDLALEVCGG